MRLSISIVALFITVAVSASPLLLSGIYTTDEIKALNYALTLESLENAFYAQGLAIYTKEDFTVAFQDLNILEDSDLLYENILGIAAEEQANVALLSTALGGQAVEPSFTFPFKDARSWVGLSSVLEGVGVSAYLGAPSIMTFSSARIRGLRRELLFSQIFNDLSGINEVYSLAASFITSIPASDIAKPQIKIKPVPALSFTSTINSPVKPGDTITISTPVYIPAPPAGQKIYAAFPAVTGPVFVDANVVEDGPEGSSWSVKVPDGFFGQTYVVLTESNDKVNDNTIIAGPLVIEITN